MIAPVRQSPAERAALRRVELGAKDAERYRRIFRLQERGDWAGADALIAEVEDDRLMGHVAHQRLMHPTAYRARYAELKDWLERYADHPGADRIFALAERRMAKGDARPRRPDDPGERVGPGTLGREGLERPIAVAPRGRGHPSGAQAQAASDALAKAVARALSTGDWAAARAALATAKGVDPLDADAARIDVAAGLFFDGRVRDALELARAAAERSGDSLPRSHWIAGLAAWRIGQHERAARHFEALARSEKAGAWEIAAGAFWAARAHGKLRRPAERNRWLERAAEHPRSFYGLIAHGALGREPRFHFQVPPLTARHAKALAEHDGARRAVALLQAGQPERAEQELRRLDPGDPVIGQALVTLADRAGLPALALHLGSSLTTPAGGLYDAALYPLPPWRPQEGFRVDRALLFALMRQESRFLPQARSDAGAAGLMQLMPATASFMGDGQDFRGADRRALFEPVLNLTLGQRYVSHLLARQAVGDNLLRLLAAYNAGPGTLQRWHRRLDAIDDPLLYLESLPSAETRGFVSLVLTNYWIYRMRLGQPAPSLDDIAAGRWPVYIPKDVSDNQVALDGED